MALNTPKFTEKALQMAEHLEKRNFNRIEYRVEVSIKNLRNSREIYARSTNISQGGLGIKFTKIMRPGDRLELWIHLPDGLKPIHRFGTLVWLKKIKPFLYKGGIRFNSLLSKDAAELICFQQ